MPDDAGIDIDMDAELAALQGRAAGMSQDGEPGAGELSVIDGEVADDKRTVEFLGRRFRIADRIGVMPLLKFSMYADMNVQDPKALAAMYAMLRDCIYPGTPACGECEHCAPDRCGECRACTREVADEEDRPGCLVNVADEAQCAKFDPGDWRAFEDHAMETRADADDLMDVITKTMELMAGRPTKPSSRSSAGRRGISAGSTARSSGRRAKGSRR